MRVQLIILMLTAAVVLLALPASAEYDKDNYDPESLYCPFGYNDAALTNLCVGTSGDYTTGPLDGTTGTVGLSGTICPIGYTCVPGVGYDPSGGVPYHVPGTPPVPTHVDCVYVEVGPLAFCQEYQISANGPCGAWPRIHCNSHEGDGNPDHDHRDCEASFGMELRCNEYKAGYNGAHSRCQSVDGIEYECHEYDSWDESSGCTYLLGKQVACN